EGVADEGDVDGALGLSGVEDEQSAGGREVEIGAGGARTGGVEDGDVDAGRAREGDGELEGVAGEAFKAGGVGDGDDEGWDFDGKGSEFGGGKRGAVDVVDMTVLVVDVVDA